MARKWEQQSRSHFSLPTARHLVETGVGRLRAKFEGAERIGDHRPLTSQYSPAAHS
jgi:hypothetical protein